MKTFILLVFASLYVFQHGHILRLPCKKYALFSKITRDVKIKSNKLKIFIVDLKTCVGLCISNRLCLSINYNQNRKKCRLLDETLSNIIKLESIEEWKHYETDGNSTLNGPTCASLSPCNGHYCEDTCEGKGYKCVCSGEGLSPDNNCEVK